jgi:hypothetical protein
MSRTMMVTRFPWIAHRFLPKHNRTSHLYAVSNMSCCMAHAAWRCVVSVTQAQISKTPQQHALTELDASGAAQDTHGTTPELVQITKGNRVRSGGSGEGLRVFEQMD